MKSKEEFLAKWRYELYGMLLDSFSLAERFRDVPAAKGHHMAGQMQAALGLLDRIYADLAAADKALPTKTPQANGVVK